MGNISGNNVRVKTADGYFLEEGDIVYYPMTLWSIKKYKVKYWNDGKRGDLNFHERKKRKNSTPYYVNLRGRGGKGFYPPGEDNVYSFIVAHRTYKYLNNAKKYCLNSLNKMINTVRNTTAGDIKLSNRRY